MRGKVRWWREFADCWPVRGQRRAFKPQNMALNSAVTVDGGEIGRAQALQAAACYLAPHTDFNSILLKPSSDTGAQIIVQGKALTTLEASAFLEKNRKIIKPWPLMLCWTPLNA